MTELLSIALPIAVHTVSDVHATALSELFHAPAGFGVGSIAQVVPSQRSTSVASSPEPVEGDPTAVQALMDVHDTPLSRLLGAPAWLGVGWIDQLVPFQRSTRDRPAGRLDQVENVPTAVQALAEVHDTPLSELPMSSAGSATAWTDQLFPSQRSASGRWPELPSLYPTAVQAI